jgi:hypothetical protein
MERMSLREASGRTSLSITTLRRYIRSGRLRAEKRAGRYGPEYFVSADDLEQAGVEALDEPAATTDLVHPAASAALPAALEQALRETVPLSLFRELQMKHEQMLVQYGMMRAGGLRTIELQAELDARRRQIEESHTEAARLKDRLARESSELGRKVREYELEAEGLRVENAALREKVRALELLTRNAVTTETIDRKYEEVMDQIRRVDRLVALHDVGTLPTPDH